MKEQDQHGNPHWGKYDEYRAQVIALLGGKCVVCGTTEDLEIDHINPKKKHYEVSQMLGIASPKELTKEIKKCQLLCKPHHLEKTIRERGQKPAKGTHGTLSSYRYCKCPICTEAHSKYCAEWKKKWKRNKKRRQARRNKNV